VIWISADTSVFLTSRAELRSAILASLTFLGMEGCGGCPSMMMPRRSSVSSMEPPSRFTIWMLSRSTVW